jgi:hypothetical protein
MNDANNSHGATALGRTALVIRAIGDISGKIAVWVIVVIVGYVFVIQQLFQLGARVMPSGIAPIEFAIQYAGYIVIGCILLSISCAVIVYILIGERVVPFGLSKDGVRRFAKYLISCLAIYFSISLLNALVF